MSENKEFKNMWDIKKFNSIQPKTIIVNGEAVEINSIKNDKERS